MRVCHAIGCEQKYDERLTPAFCLEHWAKLPRDLQRLLEIHHEFDRGAGGGTSLDFLSIGHAAVLLIAMLEGREPQLLEDVFWK